MTEQAPRSLRVLFVLRAANYERQFEQLIRGLVGRGHRVHVVAEGKKTVAAPGFNRIFDSLAGETPLFTWEQFERRRRESSQSLAGLLRRSIDYLRFLEPQFEHATGLYDRASTTAPRGLRLAMKWGPWRAAAIRRRLDRVLRTLESALPPAAVATETIATHQPDVLLIAPFIELGGGQVDYLRAARSRGIPVVLPVASWDNLTNKGLIRDVPELTIVWNESQVREAVELHRLPEERVLATGAHSFDHWFGWSPSRSREEFLHEVGLPDRPYLMYVCSSAFIAGRETAFVDEWLHRLRTEAPPELREVGVLIRPHPQNVRIWHEHTFNDPCAAVYPPEGDVPSDEQRRRDYFDSLHHSAAVIGINTSALIEAAIARRAIFSIRTETHRHSQGGTLHFQHLTGADDDGVLIAADSWSEHFGQLAAQLAQPEMHADRIERFLVDFLRPNGLERPATPLAVGAIEQVAEQTRLEPRTPGGFVRMLVAVLLVVSRVLGALSKWLRNSWLGLQIRAKLAGGSHEGERARKALAKARKRRKKRRQRIGARLAVAHRPAGPARRLAGALASPAAARRDAKVKMTACDAEVTWRPGAPAGVFVLGAPRGGTSAITRVVNMLGVPISDAEDLKAGDPNNPTGFWEVPELSRVNHGLIHRFGGLSMAPRLLPDGWYADPRVLAEMDEIREMGRRLLGGGPWVFKTALTSLTLPFWVRCLEARPVIVLPVRHPIENAASLRMYMLRHSSESERGNVQPVMSMASALAIWERYIRASLIHAAGYPTYVSISSDLVDDPAAHARDLGRFLDHHHALVGERADEGEIVSFIRPDLRHHTADEKLEDPSRGVLTESQARLWKLARQIAGAHERLPAISMGPESPTTELLITERMFFEQMQDAFRAREKQMRSKLRRLEKRTAKREAKSNRSRSEGEKKAAAAEGASSASEDVRGRDATETLPPADAPATEVEQPSDTTPARDPIGHRS